MKCPFCDGARSSITVGASSSTCMAFSAGHYDEDGEWVHGVDPNWHTTTYHCSRGHRFKITRQQNSPDDVQLISTTTTAPSAV